MVFFDSYTISSAEANPFNISPIKKANAGIEAPIAIAPRDPRAMRR